MKKILMILIVTFTLVGCQEKSHFDQYKGKYTATTYTNDALGFVFALPEGAEMHSEEEIKASDEERLEGKTEDVQEILKRTKKLMHALYPDTGVSVYSYLEYFEDGANLEAYLNDMKLYYSSQDAFIPEFGEVYPATLYGETFQVLPFKIQYMDNISMVYAKEYGNYILSFVFSYPEAESIKVIQLINAFEALSK